MNIQDLHNYYESLTEEEREELVNEGAMLLWPPSEMGYDSDPEGYVAFLTTGGDGVHYNLPENSNDGKIIMTVPMSFDNENFILGESLYEFMCLGCDFGYFSLEQLAYNFDTTVEEISNAKPQSDALLKLKKHFNLEPWKNTEARLKQLNDFA